MINNTIVSVQNLDFNYGNKKIFNTVSLDIKRGKVTAILGPSGTGKTTLLKLIGGQIAPNQGKIIVAEQNVHTLNQIDLYKLRKCMGMLFQSGALLTDLNVYENVALPLREHTALNESMIRTLVLMKLNAVGLRGARNLMPNELSGGMARRVALARAIALDPMILMYDEPFTGQDPISLGILVKLIKELNTVLNLTSIIVSHDVAETLSISDYIYVLAEGKVIGQGTPKQIENCESKLVQQFMHGIADGPMRFHYPANNYYQDLFQIDNNNSVL